jgi:LAO/AO transport system kinase
VSPPAPPDAAELGRRLRSGDRTAGPAALNVIEDRSPAGRERAAALLGEVGAAEGAHLVGVTGPPGAGKSSLLSALVSAWRGDGRTVAVLAVDPSSKRSGGSLLGDRARIEHDPRDDGILIRSTAAGGRLGGLAAPTRDAAFALAAAFDIVVVETVGVGQSETDVEELCDTIAVVVQPASGDTLQFLKAGIMEVPDVLVVTKADLGDVALRALGARETPVVSVSSIPPPKGIDELVAAIDTHGATLDVPASRRRSRRLAAIADFAAEHGERAVRVLGGRKAAEGLLADAGPGLTTAELVERLERAARD